MTKPQLMIYRGLPGSGKTYHALREIWAHKDCGVMVARVNRDDIRTQNGLLHGENEDFVTSIHRAQISAALNQGLWTICDDTNLNPRFTKSLAELAVSCGAEVVYDDSFLDVPVEECIRRDKNRPDSVGEVVINRMNTQLQANLRNGKLPQPELSQRPVIVPYVRIGHNRPAYIVDIDGTLAINNGRSFYDMSRVGEDGFDGLVARVVQALGTDSEIILMSGRNECARQATIDWLNIFEFGFDELFMRADDDNRRDDVVKQELFDHHVRNKYNVLGVFDDRPIVTRMWRALGLTVFQVGDPYKEF